MYKDYQIGSRIKYKIKNNKEYFLKGYKFEFLFPRIRENIGFEEDGKGKDFTRPVLILKVFNKHFCHIVPLSTTKKRGKYFYPFDEKTGKISVALLSQSLSIDSSRLNGKIGIISKEDFIQLKQKINEILL